MSKKEKEPSEVLADFLNYIDQCRRDYQAAHDAVGMEDKRLQDLLHGLEFAAGQMRTRSAVPGRSFNRAGGHAGRRRMR